MGVWCDTYWLPEPDLFDLRDGATRQRRVRRADPPLPLTASVDGP